MESQHRPPAEIQEREASRRNQARHEAPGRPKRRSDVGKALGASFTLGARIGTAVAGIAVPLAILACVLLGGIHISNGFGFGQALGAVVKDVRMFVQCPGLGMEWKWIDRDLLGDALAAGQDYAELCRVYKR